MERGVGEGEDSWVEERQYGWRPGQPSGTPWVSMSPCGPGNRLKACQDPAPDRLTDRQSLRRVPAQADGSRNMVNFSVAS